MRLPQLYSSHLFLLVPSDVARIIDYIFFRKQRYFVSTFARSSTIGDRAGSSRSIERSVGGAYLLAGMCARKWRAGKNAGSRVDSEDRKEPGYRSAW